MVVNDFSDISFIVSIIFIVISILFFEKNKNLGLFILLSGALILRWWAINLNPFLNIWDEQYHALVAKNLSVDFLNPILFADVKPFTDTFNWTGSNVWIHKQPFFLWLMAASIKLFGASEITIRIPGMILGIVSIGGVYRIGKNIINEKAGFIAAFLMSTSGMLLHVNSGGINTDQNDMIFISLITICFWFYSEYFASKKTHWALLAGITVGFCVLTKWLTGLLIFAPWFVINLFDYKNIKAWNVYLLSVFVAIAVFIPWQFYTFIKFPMEFIHEMTLNSKHFSIAIEGHSGDSLFHFKALKILFFQKTNYFIHLILILLGSIALYVKTKSFKAVTIIVLPIVMIYLFFTIATTKMPLFTFMINSLVYLCLASVFVVVFDKLGTKLNPLVLSVISFTLLIFIGYSHIGTSSLTEKYMTPDFVYYNHWSLKTQEKIDIDDFSEKFKANTEKYLLFNTRPNSAAAFTFYSGINTFQRIPSEVELFNLQKKYNIIILRTNNLPNYITDNPDVILYDFPLWQ